MYATDEDEHIPNPTITSTAPTIQELHTTVNNWAKKKGFAVNKANRRRKKDGQYTRYTFRCDRSGQLREASQLVSVTLPHANTFISKS